MDEAIEAAVAAEEGPTEAPREVTFSNGIVLSLKPVPPLLLREAASRVRPPAIPILRNEEKGRDEPNPFDPAYQIALEEYDNKSGDASMNVLMLTGTKIKSVPEGLDKPEDLGWREVLEDVGIEINFEKPRAVYLAWMKYYAAETATDLEKLSRGLILLTGVPEEVVQKAADSFRDREIRGTAGNVPTPINRNGAGLSADAAGDGVGVGGEASSDV